MNKRTMFYGTQPITFENARRLRNHMTAAEKSLWECLAKKQLAGARFRRQHPLGDYIADFYCHEYKLAIEVDGAIHERQKEYDEERTQEMSRVGINVIRFTNEEIFSNLDSVLSKIKATLAALTVVQ